jgi:hypothetical protein
MKFRFSIFVLVVSISSSSMSPLFAEDLLKAKTYSAFELVGLDSARALGLEGQGQTIVVLDDGVQIDHPNIKDALVDGYCASKEACGLDLGKSGIQYGRALFDGDFHGSMVSGVALGRATDVAVGGVAPKANLISINIRNGNNDAIARALTWVYSIKDKYKIASVNLSAGGGLMLKRLEGLPCDLANGGEREIADAVTALANVGIPFVVASGNGSKVNYVDFPACLPNVITVGSVVSYVNTTDKVNGNLPGDISSYSNIGPQIDVLAPSEGVIAATNKNQYMIGSGTSSAAPFVAGAIALLKQYRPDITFDEIRKALASTPNLRSDALYSQLPVLHFPTALKALETRVFTNKPVIRISDNATVEQLEAAHARVLERLQAEAKIAQDKAVAEAKAASDAAAKLLLDKVLAEAKAEAKAAADAAKVAQEKSTTENLKISDQLGKLQGEYLTLNTNYLANSAKFAEALVQIDSLQAILIALQAQVDQLLKPKAETIVCTKGTTFKVVKAIAPKCPAGYKKK